MFANLSQPGSRSQRVRRHTPVTIKKKPYFTLSKAQRLYRTDFKNRSDDQLQRDIVKLRDYNRYMSSDDSHSQKTLVEGGYYSGVADPSASGVVPKDMWLHQNTQYALDEAIKEKQRRINQKKTKFLGSCDRIRRTSDGETWWHKTMANKKQISEKEFLQHANPNDILDEDETWEQYKTDMKRQDEVKYYKTNNNVYFFQTAGFEYFWK